ncbi:AsmA family protein [Siccirubricoccus phaeus]|uniref:AsmA family protein n=1 Tax=Siccirubricoccus phaeus TaxID=2595053 RepID=UPI0011F35E34|nr:AsmA family protein [Siccirubricoccus phaeus]
MRKLGLALLALLVLLLGTAWFGPRFLDWDAWRGPLTDIASIRLGRHVAVGGRITLSLLPQPILEAAEVEIGPDPDGLAIRARAMRLRLDLPALLAGRLEPREIALLGGDISLPWPPTQLPSFRPPPWLTALDARLEDFRLTLGTLQLEGLQARLTTGGIAEALSAEGRFTWRGAQLRFNASLGRAGYDGIAPLDLSTVLGGTTLAARGVLAPGGGFEGRLEASGPDLSTLLPAPAQAFRATGRLTASADLLAADDLTLDLGGQPARGAVTLRLAPAPRLDLAVVAGRLDLDAWVAALRGARGAALPVSVDLSAEATALSGVPLRRLRGAAFLEGDRITLSDVSVLLPGETALELAGATAGPRLELAIRFAAPNLRETLGALGLPLAGIDPTRLRQAEGRFRLALSESETSLAELAATVDGARVSGAGVLRQAAGGRPALGIGLTLDRLELDGLLPAWPAPARLAGFDLNLRLAAETLRWRGLEAGRAALDATLENGRATLRRLALRLGEVDIAASGAAQLGPALRFPDLMLELSGASGAALAPLLPSEWARLAPLLAEQVTLRLSGSGAPEALALKAEGDLGELRVEANATLDTLAWRGSGALTLRHPGAPRLLAELGFGAPDWLGEGSFALVANLSGQRSAEASSLTAEHLDLVAGGLRGRAQVTLALGGAAGGTAAGGARPRLTGRVALETLPLPWPRLGAREPLALEPLQALDAELALEAARVPLPGEVPLEGLSATLRLAGGGLKLEGLQARLGGGALRGEVALESGASPPRLALSAALADVTLAAPLLGLPLDLAAGLYAGELRLSAAGHSPAALAATAEGRLEVTGRDGVLTGLSLRALQEAAALPELGRAETALRQALEGGASGFDRLELAGLLTEGRLRLERAELAGEGGAASASGEIDLARGGLDLRLEARPVAEAPPVALRLVGPVGAPRRLAEVAGFLRWKAER